VPSITYPLHVSSNNSKQRSVYDRRRSVSHWMALMPLEHYSSCSCITAAAAAAVTCYSVRCCRATECDEVLRPPMLSWLPTPGALVAVCNDLGRLLCTASPTTDQVNYPNAAGASAAKRQVLLDDDDDERYCGIFWGFLEIRCFPEVSPRLPWKMPIE